MPSTVLLDDSMTCVPLSADRSEGGIGTREQSAKMNRSTAEKVLDGTTKSYILQEQLIIEHIYFSWPLVGAQEYNGRQRGNIFSSNVSIGGEPQKHTVT